MARSCRCLTWSQYLTSVIVQPVPFSLALLTLYLLGVLFCWRWTESSSTWNNLTLAPEFEEPPVNRVVDIALAGFCTSLFVHFFIQSCLRARRKNELQWTSDVVTAVAFFECVSSHVFSASGYTVTLAFDSGISGTPVFVRPLKVLQLVCAVPCMGALAVKLGRELRLLTGKEALLHVFCDVASFATLLGAAVLSWSVAGFVVCLTLCALAFSRLNDSVKKVALGSYMASDENTRAVMRLIPVTLCFMWPGIIMLCINLAGGAASLDSRTAEAISSALCTSAICYFFLLWSARDSEAAAARIAMELHKVEEKSAGADARNDAKRAFMRYIFHELRVPLNAITLGLQDMAEKAAEVPTGPVHTGDSDSNIAIEESTGSSVLASFVSGVTDTANMLMGNATAMRKLLDDFLSLEKIEQGKFEIEPVQFRVRGMVDDSVRMFTAPCAAKGLTLAVDADSTVQSTICGDVHKLRQVLCNYISNAIKFSPHGATITVSIAHGIDDHQVECVTVAVTDNGVGISKEDQAKLFQPFNQIKAGALQKGNGTGLGLSICKRIVELSGGIVGCESSEGKGSRFFFQVPVGGPPAAGAPTVASVDQPVAVVVNGSQPSSGAATTRRGSVVSDARSQDVIAALPFDAAGSRRASSVSISLQQPQSSARIAPSPLIAPQPHFALTVDTGSISPETAATGSGFFLSGNAISRNSRAPLMHSTASSPARSFVRPWEGDAGGALPPARSDSVVSASLIHADTSASASTLRIDVTTPKSALLTHAVVVDDVKSNRDIFGRMLARRGVTTIHYAEDGLQAVAFLDNLLDADLNRIQAWFLDKEMPNCDGHECAQHLRTRGITAPIFGVTGNALAEDRRLFIAAGVDAVITKPVSMDAIESALSQHGLRLLPPPTSSSTPSSRSSTPGPRRAAH